MNAVWRESKSDGRARLVLLAIADHQGEIGAWPSIRRIAQMVNSSERSVQRDIQYLQKIGELRIEVQNAPTLSRFSLRVLLTAVLRHLFANSSYESNGRFVVISSIADLPHEATLDKPKRIAS